MEISGYKVEVLSRDEVRVGCARVTRAQVAEVLKLMDEFRAAPKFKLGDFVRVLSSEENVIPRGTCGEVVEVRVVSFPNGYTTGVKFAERFAGAHDLSMKVPIRHGYWFRDGELELVP